MVFVKFCTSAVKEGLGTIAHKEQKYGNMKGECQAATILMTGEGGGDVFDKPSLSLM